MDRAKQDLILAVQYDKNDCLYAAEYHYRHGIESFLTLIRDLDNSMKQKSLQRIQEYLDRYEDIKTHLYKFISEYNAVNHISIMEDSTGYGYEEIFGNYIDRTIKEVYIEEPYLFQKYQIINLIKFLEFVVKRAPQLCYVSLTTKDRVEDVAQQRSMFEEIKTDLAKRKILITYKYKTQQHDRKIVFSNGYIINIGYGLDIYKFQTSMGLGLNDPYFRKCRQTEVKIMRSKHSANGKIV